MAIEPATAALAARKRTAADLDLIAGNIARTRVSLADGQALVTLDIEFHSLIAQAAANRAIVLAREALSQLIYPAFKAVLVFWPRTKPSLKPSPDRTSKRRTSGWSGTSPTFARAMNCSVSTLTCRSSRPAAIDYSDRGSMLVQRGTEMPRPVAATMEASV